MRGMDENEEQFVVHTGPGKNWTQNCTTIFSYSVVSAKWKDYLKKKSEHKLNTWVKFYHCWQWKKKIDFSGWLWFFFILLFSRKKNISNFFLEIHKCKFSASKRILFSRQKRNKLLEFGSKSIRSAANYKSFWLFVFYLFVVVLNLFMQIHSYSRKNEVLAAGARGASRPRRHSWG